MIAGRLSLVLQVKRELELAELLADVERELYQAGRELDRFYAELELELERDRRRALVALSR